MRTGSRRGAALVSASLLLGLASACVDRDPERLDEDDRVEDTTAPAPLEVLWAGCPQYELGPAADDPITCVITLRPDAAPRSLTLWVPSSVHDHAVVIDSDPILPEDEVTIDSGRSFGVPAAHSGRLRLTGVVGGQRRELLTLDIELRAPRHHRLKTELDAAVGKPAQQLELARTWSAQRDATTSASEALELSRFLQYLAYDRGRWRDSAAEAVQVARWARELGQTHDECHAAWSASFILGHDLGELDQAQEVLGRFCEHGDRIPTVAVWEGYYRGILELRLGEVARARRTIERAFDIARRLRLAQWQRLSIAELVEALSSQGRFEWARSLLERSHELAPVAHTASETESCTTEVIELQRHGEVAQREQQMLGTPSSQAREHWQRALARAEGCPKNEALVSVLSSIQLSLAEIAIYEAQRDGARLDEAQLDEARQRLDAIDPSSLPALGLRRYRLLRAELALARDHLDEAERELGALATDPSVRPHDHWRRLWLEARLHQARGDFERAVDSLLRAEQQLERAVAKAGEGLEADRFLAMRRQTSQLLVRLLLELGHAEDALCAARMARIRGLLGPLAPPPEEATHVAADRARLSETYAWFGSDGVPMDERLALQDAVDHLMSVSADRESPVRCDDLVAPSPDELSLMPFQDSERWVVFAWGDAGEVRVHELAPGPLPPDPAALGGLLLDPFDDLLADARRLRVVPPAALHAISMPSLPWRGASVGDAMTVVHAIDGPPVLRSTPLRPSATLVLSDPRGRLQADHHELLPSFEGWAAALDAHALSTTSLRRVDETDPTLGDVLEGTEDVTLAVLYGFGATLPSRYEPSSAESTDDPARVTFDLGATGLLRADVLQQRGHVPHHVIMAHCDSATVDPHGVSGAVGLAQTYVRAGSQWAIGTAGTVDPSTMRVVVDELVGTYVEDSRIESVAATLRVIESRHEGDASSDVHRFRLWVL